METYLNHIDTEKVDNLLQETGINVNYFNNACQNIVNKYSEALDDLMKEIYVVCVKKEDTSLDNLEKYYLELSNMIYFMNEKVEQLGVYADMSASASKEVYSKSYIAYSSNKDIEGKSKATVKENEAKANLDAQYESVVADIYDRAYKIVKSKVDSGKDLMNCLRKIITSRTAEMQLSLYAPRGEKSDNADGD